MHRVIRVPRVAPDLPGILVAREYEVHRVTTGSQGHKDLLGCLVA